MAVNDEAITYEVVEHRGVESYFYDAYEQEETAERVAERLNLNDDGSTYTVDPITPDHEKYTWYTGEAFNTD